MKEIYVKPTIVSNEKIYGPAPVAGFLVAYALGRSVKKAVSAAPIMRLPHFINMKS
ncbi:hypothetical protein [Selenomonas sp. KH1T6]|uniref:hypothetical protein n=1 Tax=Selenomonas sp. KH1T6 TaxID=3158784 RepID=UPI0008A72D1B|nr:hypothetical protein SAMN05216583_103164 [Selenomonas ruminantium]